MRHCEMCGTVIPQGKYVCGNCGGIVSEEGSGTDRIIGNPDWGKISIDFGSFRGDAVSLFARIKDCWLELETLSAQRLFNCQLENRVLPISSLILYGPRESFTRLMGELTAAGVESSIIEFQSMSYDEIYKLRDIEGNESGKLHCPVRSSGTPP